MSSNPGSATNSLCASGKFFPLWSQLLHLYNEETELNDYLTLRVWGSLPPPTLEPEAPGTGAPRDGHSPSSLTKSCMWRLREWQEAAPLS